MKKAFDQTVRDIKREVNKKVLKVPSIEQKVLDATSNEPWGPHGTLLADIAQASRNYHEYQMIMSVIWKRINDTGKNWRHVYKALTVLEYLVAHGSERVIDDIREHAYQIQTLSDFQYIDSSGRDQGSNVRKKSQSLVVLVNDKDRIQEVRQKAAANRDKYRNTSAGGMYRPGSYSSAGGYGDRYDDDRYGSRDEDRNGYGREREWGARDDERYGRYGDSYGRDADRYGRDDDRYNRDGYRDDDYRGRSRSVDDYQYGSRSRSSDRDRDRAYEDEGQYSSSRGNGAKADDQSQDGSYAGRHLERKYSEQNLGAPPSYEEAVSVGRSPTYSDRDGEIPSAAAPKSSSPPASASPSQSANNVPPQPAPASPPPPPVVADQKQDDGFDEFDPRSSFSAAPATSNITAPTPSGGAEMDLLGSLSESFSPNSLALVPTTAIPTASEDVHVNSGPTFVVPSSASSVSNQTFDDPFGDGPFKAMTSTDDLPAQPQNVTSTFAATSNHSPEPPQLVPQRAETVSTFGDSFPVASNVHPSAANMQYSPQELSTPNQDIDILADILPPTGPQPVTNPGTAYTAPTGQPSFPAGFQPQSSQTASQVAFPSQTGPTVPQTNLQSQPGQLASLTNYPARPGQPSIQTSFNAQSGQIVPHPNFLAQTSQSGQPAPVAGFPSQMGSSPQAAFLAQPAQQNPNFYGSFNPQMGSTGPVAPQMATQQNSINFLSQSGSAAPVSSQMTPQSPQIRSGTTLVSQTMLSVATGSATAAAAPQPAKDKFETKSTVWTDTLSRGLVNLNISGPKTNPLADIGVDFDAINRKEKRMEKPTTAPVVSNITMGKAMGSGSGMGRAGAGVLRPPPNPMMGSGIGMGMGGGPGPGMGMGGYGSVNQPMGGGMGMNMPPNMGMGMGMGMNMGVAQGGQMQRPMGFAPGSNIPGGYNPVMGMGNYGQQPYGGGYR